MVLLASALGLGLVIGLSDAFGGDPAAGLSLPGSDSQQAGVCWRSGSLHSRAIPWMWWCAPMRSPAPRREAGSKHSSVSRKAFLTLRR